MDAGEARDMTSQLSYTPKQQSRKLHFFPASYPDETLYSRVSRYHILRGERKDENTFIELFGEKGHKVDFDEHAPISLRALASLLPGDPLVQLGKILSENTFLPFVVPIVDSRIEEYPGKEFANARSCEVCLEEDEQLVGSAYLHRCHQLPAVSACWKHGVKLIDACPCCGLFFKKPGKFFGTPVTGCSCGWRITNHSTATAAAASNAEHEFAVHAHGVLLQRTLQTSLPVLVRFFLTQVEQNNYKMEASGTISRRLLAGMISQQLREQKNTTEIVMAAATVIASAKSANWGY
jgi:hypothetical protein